MASWTRKADRTPQAEAMTPPASFQAPRPSLNFPYSWARSIVFLTFLWWAPLVAGLTLWAGLNTVVDEFNLQREGVTTAAVVMAHRRSSSETHNTDRILTLLYMARLPGSPTPVFYQQEATVNAERYLRLAGGRSVLIRHSHPNPTLFRLADDPPWPELGQRMFLFGLALLFCVPLSGEIVGMTALILLAFRADTLPGRLVDLWEEDNDDGDPVFCVSYCFQPPGSGPRFAAEVLHRRAFHALQPGDPVMVRAVRGRPEICQLKL
jgi:hypothetical protein